MPRIEMSTETSRSPDEVVAALTDFSERRPQIWPGIAPRYYEVFSVGETSAEVREGSTMGPLRIWARERYDWSTPGVVSWTVQESNFCKSGSYVKATITPRDDGGSRIDVEWERTAANPLYGVMFRMLVASKGKPLTDSMNKGLANYERMKA